MRGSIELLDGLNPNEMEIFHTMAIEKSYQKGNILFFEGEMPDKLFLLLDGIVKVYKVDPKGNEILLHFFQPQTLIAETAHMQKIPYPATCQCETACRVYEIDYARFEERFLRNPDISFKMICSLSQKIKFLQNVIAMNLTMDTQSRLCRFLEENERHLETMSQRKIAAILNITPETLSRTMAVLKKEGIVAIEKRKIRILDTVRLRDFH